MGDLLSGFLRCFPSFLSFFPTFSFLGWDLISTRHYVDVVPQITLALVVLSFGAVLEPLWFNDRQTSLVLHPWFGPIAVGCAHGGMQPLCPSFSMSFPMC